MGLLQREDVRGALQSSLGMLLLLATVSAPVVWDALTDSEVNVGPVYAVVSYNVVLQSSAGAAVLFILQRFAGASVGGTKRNKEKEAG